jgi:tetratricopeptide (TPR) repeat protein
MQIEALIGGLVLALAPLAMADDAMSVRAVGFICSAEQDAVPQGSHRELVRVAGVGTGGFPIVTIHPEAQAWFDYGMQLAHAFYHEDAKAAFKKAMEIDPQCAMCAWGEAWSLGPTINYDVDAGQIRAAAEVVAKAGSLAGGESEKNKALIAALKLRTGTDHAAADLAYAKAVDALVVRYPGDDELAILTSDAWIEEWRFHDDGQGLARAVHVLEPVLQRHPDNTGAIHFYIHATEINGQPALALPYAERLGALAPGASHLVHMASHTFFRVGRYEDAAIANAQAIAVDAAYLRAAHDASPQGAVMYHGHNLIFGLSGALASGDAPLGLRLAKHAPYAFPPAIANDGSTQLLFGDAYTIYGRYAPDKALALADPGPKAPIAQALRHYARGEAFAARGDLAGVRAEAALTVAPAAQLAPLPERLRTRAGSVVKIAQLTLQGRAAMLAGDPKAATAAYGAAAAIQDRDFTGVQFHDPPPWWYPERRSLAAALLAAQDPAGAAREARAALNAWPRDPLSLRVLGEAEAARGQSAAAERDQAEARRAWHGGKMPLARL